MAGGASRVERREEFRAVAAARSEGSGRNESVAGRAACDDAERARHRAMARDGLRRFGVSVCKHTSARPALANR